MKMRIVSLLMALCMVFAVFSECAVPAMASTQAEINKLKEQAQEISKNKKDLQKEIDRLKAEAKDATAQKELLDKQNDMIRGELKNAEEQIAQYEKLIEQTKKNWRWQNRKKRISMSSSAAVSVPWKKTARCPIGRCCSTQAASPTC